MTALIIVAAVARNGVIGKDNRLPWHLSEDMRHFKALTTGHAVIMGRKIWESLPERFRPLPGRANMVISRDPGYRAPGAAVFGSLGAALAGVTGDRAFVIGGAQLYEDALKLADRLELTELDADFDGDAWFPAFDRAAWTEVARDAGRSEKGLDYAFVAYERRR
jgi:dihydrofolate reductase